MKDTLALPRSVPAPRPILDAAARRIIHRSLERLRFGRLTLHDQGERYPYGEAAEGARRRFARADQDGNGVLTKAEIRRVLIVKPDRLAAQAGGHRTGSQLRR